MPHCLNFCLLTIFTCHIAPALSIPQLPNLTVNVTQPPKPQMTCASFSLFVFPPRYSDCTRALDAIPSSADPGWFHDQGKMDEWQLPFEKADGTCEISVQMSPFVVVEGSSWSDVKSAATEVVEACRVRKVRGDVTGGEIKVGRHDWIRVYVRRAFGAEEVVDG